jgi:hypothetical protein
MILLSSTNKKNSREKREQKKFIRKSNEFQIAKELENLQTSLLILRLYFYEVKNKHFSDRLLRASSKMVQRVYFVKISCRRKNNTREIKR